jgi:threonine synthase
VSFAVPTGNFGDVLAGYVAKRMGLPIERLTIGTNSNDILVRTLQGGAYEMQGVSATTSPSMDIQISSNFERLLFEVHDRDGAAVRRLMQSLSQSGRFEIAAEPLARIRSEFDAAAIDEAAVASEIGQSWREAGYLLDPHTAIGVAAARKGLERDSATPMIVLGTAHPAKFPAAVKAASGVDPALPAHLADLMERQEHFTLLPNDQARIEDFVRRHARAVTGAAA